MFELFKHPTAYRSLQCVVCEGWYSPDFMVATIDNAESCSEDGDCDSFTLYGACEHRGVHCCTVCAVQHNGPGMFERYSDSSDEPDLEDMGTALILHSDRFSGDEDDQMFNDGWGYCGRFGKYLLMQDTSGFVTFEEYPNDDKASKEFERLYLEGWGAQENDAYVSCDRGRWYVSFDGKELDVWSRTYRGANDRRDDEAIDERRCIARVRLESMKTGYYPDLWLQSERGDLTHVSY